MNAQVHGEETIEPRMRALDADPGREKDPHSYEQRKGARAEGTTWRPAFAAGALSHRNVGVEIKGPVPVPVPASSRQIDFTRRPTGRVIELSPTVSFKNRRIPALHGSFNLSVIKTLLANENQPFGLRIAFDRGSDERGLNQKEENMKLISNHELDQRSESELSALFRAVSEELVRTRRGSPERRNALASLENISQARAERMSIFEP
jgi:hypothetical protein